MVLVAWSHVQLFVTPWTIAHQVLLSSGILKSRILVGVAIPFSKGSSWPRDQTQVSCIARRFFTIWATGKPTMCQAIKNMNKCSSSGHNMKELKNLKISKDFKFLKC